MASDGPRRDEAVATLAVRLEFFKMRILIVIACLIVVLAAAGCGSGSSSDSASSGDSSSASTASATNTNASNESGESPPSATPPTKPPAKIEIPTNVPKDKLATADLKEGAGATARDGDELTVQYIGVGSKSEKTFDSSWEREEPLSFQLGEGEVIKGWDEGIVGMKVGGRRELYIPAHLAYGSEGTASIAPNEAIVFVIDLLAVKKGSS